MSLSEKIEAFLLMKADELIRERAQEFDRNAARMKLLELHAIEVMTEDEVASEAVTLVATMLAEIYRLMLEVE